MAAPAVISPGIIGGKSAAKVGGGESGYLLVYSEFNGCGVKRGS